MESWGITKCKLLMVIMVTEGIDGVYAIGPYTREDAEDFWCNVKERVEVIPIPDLEAGRRHIWWNASIVADCGDLNPSFTLHVDAHQVSVEEPSDRPTTTIIDEDGSHNKRWCSWC